MPSAQCRTRLSPHRGKAAICRSASATCIACGSHVARYFCSRSARRRCFTSSGPDHSSALGLARIQVRQGGEQPLQLRQEVFGVGGDGWRVNQNFVGDEGTSHLTLPRRERGKNEHCEGSFSQPLTSAWHHVRT